MTLRQDGLHWRMPRSVSGRAGLSIAALTLLALGVALYPRLAGAKHQADAAEQSFVIQPRPFVSTISVVGVIAPGDSVDIVAPLDGRITKVGFEYGAAVHQGQVLVEFDTSEARQRRDEAKANFLRAMQAETEMSSWSSGPDVSRARRAVNAAS